MYISIGIGENKFWRSPIFLILIKGAVGNAVTNQDQPTLTWQCVPAHRLIQHTFTARMDEVRKHHARWLKDYLHVRYWYLPYTDDVIVGLLKPDDGSEVCGGSTMTFFNTFITRT
jgi:hypothetical protein